MSSHLAVLASLALAIFLSPETLVLGLIIAGDKKVPRLAALAYALGGILGIAFATTIGLLIAHASGTDTHTADHHGWPSFIVRVVIATALITIGARRAVNALRKKPISDVAQPEHKPGAFKPALTRRFPGLDPNADLPVPRRVSRAGLAGFAASTGRGVSVFAGSAVLTGSCGRAARNCSSSTCTLCCNSSFSPVICRN